MDTGILHYGIIGEVCERAGAESLASRPGGRRRRNATAFGVRPLLLLMMLTAFCICASARAQQAGPGGTAPVSGVAAVPSASNDKVSLTPEERQWLSRHDGQIRIGITVIPPQVLHGDGEYKGLAIDYIRLLERKLGCRFKLVPYATWNEVIQAAKVRRIDMIFAAQRTPERLTYLLFTEPYIELPNMILVRKDRQGGSSLKEMKGWSVAASERSAVHEYLKKEFGYLDLRPVQDELSGLMKVSMGEVDAMVVEISRASYYIEKAGILNLRVAGNAGLLYQLRFAVRNDWPVLCGILDKGLSSITDEERRNISQRWIIVGGRSIFASRAFWISFVAGLGVITLTVVGVIGWNRTLRRIVRQRTSQLQQELAERKKAEEALRDAYEYSQQLISSANVMIVGLDAASRVRIFNHAAEKITGYRIEELSDINWFEKIVPQDRYAYVWETFRNYQQKTGAMPTTFENPILTKSNEERVISWQNSTISTPGAEIFTISFGIDITERKLAEEELRRLKDELEQRVQERTAELAAKNAELERMNRLFVGRELRMVELKEKIAELERKSAQ